MAPEAGDEETLYCENHPDRETRVTCANCGKPICPECMRPTPVGIKCAQCANPLPGQIRRGKPEQYVGATLAGIGSALVGGYVGGVLLTTVGFGFFLGLILGAGVGSAVRKGAQGNRGGAFIAIGAGSGFLAAIVSGAVIGFGIFGSTFGLIYLVASTAVAGLMLRE